MQKTITKIIILVIVLISSLGVNYLFAAWIGPAQAPTSGNVSEPVYVNTTNQIKDGGLSVDALSVFGSKYVQGTIQIGNSNITPQEGIIRWTGVDYEGYNGVEWLSLTIVSCGEITDTDGNIYNTVVIGDQCWMRTNLHVGVKLASATTLPTNNSIIEKWCYDGIDANCLARGGLYTWDEAMGWSDTGGAQGICPSGWHIPTDLDYKILEMELGMSQVDADATGWERGTDEGTKLKDGGSSHIDALISGVRWVDLDYGKWFIDWDVSVRYWSSTEYNWQSSWVRYLNSTKFTVLRTTEYKAQGNPVRCVKD